MSWIFKQLEVAAAVASEKPTRAKMTHTVGQLAEVVIIVPASTAPGQVGVRISTPERVIIPKTAEGSDAWIFSQLVQFELELTNLQDLGLGAPINLILEAFNSDSGAKFVQVGMRFTPWASESERMLRRISEFIQVMADAATWPEIERQIRRVMKIIKSTLRGSDDG